MSRSPKIALLTLLLLLVAPAVQAARPGFWETRSIEDWLEGEFDGTGLSSEAKLLPTFPARESDIPARIAWGSARLDDRQFVGTSLPAGIYEVRPDGTTRVLLASDELGFTALRKWKGNLYAAATPSGNLYRMKPADTTFQRVATLSDSYVWSMSPGPDGEVLYLATGPRGGLYRYDGSNAPRRVTRTPGNNIMALTAYRGGMLLGDDAGGLYRLNGEDELESVYGFKNGEIAALAADDEFFYVGVNHQQVSGQQDRREESRSELADQLRQQALQEQRTNRLKSQVAGNGADSPTPVQTESDILMEAIRKHAQKQGSGLFSELSGTLVYRMGPPHRMNVIYNDPEEIVHDLEANEGTLYVATGGKGRLYKIEEDFTRVAYYKSQQKLVTDVELEDGRVERLTTGEGATLVRGQPFSPQTSRYRSSTFDAHLLARWGALRWDGEGSVSVRTRSGNSNRADTQWSSWTDWQSGETTTVNAPPARFLQFEVRFNDPRADVSRLEVAYQIPNQRPRLADLAVSPNPVDRILTNDSNASGGNNDNGSSQGGSAPSLHALFERGVPDQRQVHWKVVDPDGDPVVSKLYYKPVDGTKWIPLNNDQYLTGSSYTINTRSFSNGRYQLKVVATDRLYNEPDQGFVTEKVSDPLLIDNAAPVVEDLRVDGSRVTFRARDHHGTILLVQYRVNGSPWQALLPEDTIFDESSESFELTLQREIESGDLLEIRVLDEAGNRGQRRTTLGR